MNLAGGDERERLLAAAWDESTEPYQVLGSTLLIRPFSANVLRRAGTMELRCLYGDFREVLGLLPPTQALGELEALAWLLCGDLDTVRAAMRSGTWVAALDRYELPRGARVPFRDEMARVLALIQAAMFTTEDKPKPATPPGRSAPEEPEPPAHLVRPGVVATLAFALAEKMGKPADELLEWIPACQVFQLAHCLQWGNTSIWTVDPRAPVAGDPWEGAAPEEDPGYGEEIDF